jgi:hypothetical protein
MITKHFEDIENTLKERLVAQVKAGKLEGEQWFRNPLGWLLVCFNNPLNFKNPNGELVVLQNNKESISKYIKGYSQLHYGVGVGETELEIVRFELEQSKKVNLEAVDISKTFIELFGENLKDKEFEFGNDSIDAKLHQDLFQNHLTGLGGNVLHICLGGTLGNFDDKSKELWDIFSKDAKKDDLLMIGIKTNKYFDIDLEKYKTNEYYPSFVLSHIKDVHPSKISWRSDDKGYIRMFYEAIEVFRTRRFSEHQLISEAEERGFSKIDSWICEYGHSLVVLFKKR